jgi:hypothetical protein
MMKLEDQTFLLYAAKYYDNPHCHDIIEFEEDLKRFQYLRKLFNRYKQLGELKERLILNHLIVIYNCFGPNATNMLFMKLEEYSDHLKPFIEYLNYMPEFVEYGGKRIHNKAIPTDHHIKVILSSL